MEHLSPRNNVVIKVEGMEARYGETMILQGISFEVQRGEIFVILGGSGCGKSTLLKHLIGLYRPYRGNIVVENRDLATVDEDELVEIRKGFGVLFQSAALLASMTLAENVALPIHAHTDLPPELVNLLVRVKLNMVNLSGFEDYLPAELSGGMKKRAGLARAMALDPTILFFDEPTAGLDPVTSAELDHLILQINRSLHTTMVIVTHELSSIFAIAHRVIMLDGKEKTIIAQGDPRDLKEKSLDPRVHKFFNRKAE
jgi:phospholipid/cholesterol/gamma-HCH transport system ATP-binding protein